VVSLPCSQSLPFVQLNYCNFIASVLLQVYVIDLDTALSAIPKLKSKNAAVRIVCYFSAGSWEDYRCVWLL
jgi:hypothetical protein